eukprot:scaffold603_cov404-Prasinococcus_capsulatus_cf.AAC.2
MIAPSRGKLSPWMLCGNPVQAGDSNFLCTNCVKLPGRFEEEEDGDTSSLCQRRRPGASVATDWRASGQLWQISPPRAIHSVSKQM